MTSNQSSV